MSNSYQKWINSVWLENAMSEQKLSELISRNLSKTLLKKLRVEGNARMLWELIMDSGRYSTREASEAIKVLWGARVSPWLIGHLRRATNPVLFLKLLEAGSTSGRFLTLLYSKVDESCGDEPRADLPENSRPRPPGIFRRMNE